MLHFVARARRGRLLFVTWTEGVALWERVVGACGGLEALVLMPDHLHLLHDADVRLRLAAALSGYTRWLKRRRGTAGPLFEPLPPPDRALSGEKRVRSVRYVHLNPCRARLVPDPLAWPLSTHRDTVGLAVFPVVDAHADPRWLHHYVSADPTVHVDGTELPTLHVAVPTAGQVLHATSALARAPLASLGTRGPARSLYLRAAKTLTADSHGAIGAGVGVARWAVLEAQAREDARVKTIARVVGDPRFPPLWDEDLRRQSTWARYRDRS